MKLGGYRRGPPDAQSGDLTGCGRSWANVGQGRRGAFNAEDMGVWGVLVVWATRPGIGGG